MCTISTCPCARRFTGKERDTETNNDDFGARYYSSQFGRWLSPDWSAIPAPVPYADLTNPQTLNLYAMIRDNPETFSDLNGHFLTELKNYFKYECWCNDKQLKNFVDVRRQWLQQNVITIDNIPNKNFGQLSNTQVLNEYNRAQAALNEGRYSVEGQPPSVPGSPVGNVPGGSNWRLGDHKSAET